MALRAAALLLWLASPRPPPGPALAAALDAGLPLQQEGAPRAVWASGLLRGARYAVSPLGEGRPPDADPRFRLDAFDCVTFVETAIALGNAATVAEARALLDDIRYDGPPDFAHRNHYVEAEWIPANLRKGWIEGVTRRIAGGAAREEELVLTRERWRAARRSGRLIAGLDPARMPTGRFALPYVPLDRLEGLAPRIPEGTILLLVRAGRPGALFRVTHMGIVVVGPGGERLLRHASDLAAAPRVRDEPLARFVARFAHRLWPAAGVSLWAIRDDAARVRELLSRR